MAYSDKLLDHFNNPRNMGSLDKKAPDVGTGVVGSPECGDVMKLQIKVDGKGVITDARFKTFGCAAAIASSSLATEWLKGRTIEQADTLSNTRLAEELALPPIKIHCSVLAEGAVKAAIEDWKVKHGRGAEEPSAAPSLPCEQCPGRTVFGQLAPAQAGGKLKDYRLIGLRDEANRVLAAVEKALADKGDALGEHERHMLDMAVAMLKATVGRDDPDQVLLAIDMVNEAAQPLMQPEAINGGPEGRS